MEMGDYIKRLRTGENKYDKKMTQEELGKMLNPKVGRGAINKWESGEVENIRRTHILQMAEIFGVQPYDLMCFDEERIGEEVKVIEQVQKTFGKDAVALLNYFYNLNDLGKEKALEALSDLTEHPRFKVGERSVQGDGSR